MAAAGDLAFILRVQDQGTPTIKAFTQGLQQSGASGQAAATQISQTVQAAKAVKDALNTVNQGGLKGVTDAAAQAAQALKNIDGAGMPEVAEEIGEAKGQVIDFATAIEALGKKIDGIKPAGRIREIKTETDEASGGLDNIAKAAKGVAEAIVGIYVANHNLREAIEEYRVYESAVNRVVSTTQLAGEALVDYQARIDASSQALKGVGTEALNEYAQVAGQLGIRGAPNVVAFAETIGKLAAVTDVAGHEGAQSLGRLLLLTGEGAEGAKGFANVLVELSQNSKASAAEILSLTSMVAQNSSQFKLGSATIAGYGAAAAQLNLQPMLFGSIFGRTLLAIKDAALNSTQGIQTFSRSIGMSRSEILKLIETDPGKVFELFLSSLNATSKAGLSTTGILAELNLQGEESQRILGTAANNIGSLIQKRKEAEEASKAGGKGPLDTTFDRLQQTLDPQLKGISGSFSLLMKNIGAAVAPLVKVFAVVLAGAINAVNAAFTSLSGPVQSVIAVIALLGPAVLAVKGAFAALNVVVGFVGGWGVLFAPILDVIVPIGAALFTIAEGTAAAFGVVPLAIGAVVAAVVAAGVVIYQNWDAVKRAILDNSWVQGVIAIWGSLTGAIEAAWAAIREVTGTAVTAITTFVTGLFASMFDAVAKKFTDFKGFLTQGWQAIKDVFTMPLDSAARTPFPTWGKELDAQAQDALMRAKQERAALEERKKIADEDAKLVASHGHGPGEDNPGSRAPQFILLPAAKQAIAALDQIANVREQIREADAALETLEENSRKVTLTGDPSKDGDARSQSEIDRLRALNELRKRQLDPVTETIRLQGVELQTLAAVTAEQKNRVEVEKVIREETEKRGLLQEGEAERLRASTAALQAQRLTNAIGDQSRELTNQLAIARAQGELARQRVEQEQKIAEFIRTQGDPGGEQIQRMRDQLAAISQESSFRGLQDSLNPVMAAQRKFLDDAIVLGRQANIPVEERVRLFEQLSRTQLQSTSPLAYQAKLMTDQITLSEIQGDYAKADTQTQEKLNELRGRGVVVSQEQVAALKEANRAMQDLQKSKSSGLEGWTDQVGSLRDAMLDLQKDFASGLSSSITKALTGSRTSFRDFARDFSNKVIQKGVDQLLKEAFGGDSVNNLFGTGSNEAAKRAQDAADKLKSLSPQTVTMTAGTVYVNGQPVSGNGGYSGAGKAGDGTQTLSLPNVSALNVSGDVRAAGFGVAGVTSGAFGIRAGSLGTAGSGYASEITRGPQNTGDTAAYLAERLKALGANPATVRGFLGSTDYESAGLQSGIKNPTSGAYGVFQYLGSRKTGLQNQYGADPTGRQQVDYAINEILSGRDGSGGKTLRLLRSGQTEEDGLKASLAFERPSQKEIAGSYSERLARSGRYGSVTSAPDPQLIAQAKQTQEQLRQVQAQGGQAQAEAVRSASEQSAAATKTFGDAVAQTGDKAATAAPQVQQATEAQAAAGNASGAASVSTDQVADGMGKLSSQAASAIPGLQGFGGMIGSLVQMLLKGAGGGASGGAGAFGEIGKIGTAVAGLFHVGGVVGHTPGSGFRTVSGSWSGVPRFHTGGGDGVAQGEYRAILQRGERVLTAKDDARTVGLMKGVSAMKAGQASGGSTSTTTNNVKPTFGFNITMQGSSGDPAQDQQHAADTAATINGHVEQAMNGWVTREQRPGGILYSAGAMRS